MKTLDWGKLPDGRNATKFILSNKNGMEVAITNFGATIVSLKIPDCSGHIEDVVLGYDHIAGYVTDRQYLGASIGRYANRISNGQFVLDGTLYSLARNEGMNTLHGGLQGFNKKLWKALPANQSEESIEFEYQSTDGDEGFPGNLKTQISFTLDATNALRIDYTAVTDKTTVVNLTNHSYFNLAGSRQQDILEHRLFLNADEFLPCNEMLIPNGKLAQVKNTPFDFRQPTPIGARINERAEQLQFGKGYDHSWVLKPHAPNELILAAQVTESVSGRMMQIFTTEPAIQFYSGNVLTNCTGRSGRAYHPRDAFCLETQHFPDSPNHPEFPSTVLRPDGKFSSSTVYSFAWSR